MYIGNEEFKEWMERILQKLETIGKDVKVLCKTTDILEDEKLLDNQDLAFLLKVSTRTLQRMRSTGKLPYFQIGKHTYYKASDIRKIIQEWGNSVDIRKFDQKFGKGE